MKRFLLIVMAALMCSMTFASVENTENKEVASNDDNASYSFYKNYSHWSIAVSGGFNFLMCERTRYENAIVTNYKSNFLGSFNAEVEYSGNPIWGVALNYKYAPIAKGAIFKTRETSDINPSYNGQGHQAYAMMNINLLNVFERYRKHTEWGWYAGVGVGVLVYNVSKEMYDENYDGNGTWKVDPMIPFETKVEYSPINSLSIFAKASMDIYLADAVNLCVAGSLSDWNLYGGVGIRWNIGASKKQSVRTVDMNTYEGGSKRIKKDGDNDDDKMKAMETQLAELQKQIAELQKKGVGGANAESVASVEKKTDANTEEINKIKSELEIIREAAMLSNKTDENSVYFENNSSRVTPEYEIIIAKVARTMIYDKTLHLDLTSYCSKEGNSERNKKLGEERLDAVRYILVNRYKISENRIHAHYNGQVEDDFDTMNRRCDLKFREK